MSQVNTNEGFNDNDNYENYSPMNNNDNRQPVAYNAQQAITMQPQTLQNQYPGDRRQIPVSTLDWRSTDRSLFIPIHGLDFLIGVNSLLIQQTVELGDMMTTIESENRYLIKVPDGETLYMGTELSSPLQRLMCGSKRSFSLSLSDHSRQEALIFKRKMAASLFCIPCKLQEIHVLAPPGDYLGRIQQTWTVSVPFFLIYDNNDDLLYVVEGPSMNFCCAKMDIEFKILTGDAMTEQGSIVHKWDNRLVNYNMNVNFPTMCSEPRIKALIIGAAFLLEYTYFVRAKSTKCLSCC